MSAIAYFIKLPKTALDGLRAAAILKKRLFGAPRDTFHDYLDQHGQEVVDYGWSGYMAGSAMDYLQRHCQTDLKKSEYSELSAFLSRSRDLSLYIFTDATRQSCLAKLEAEFSEDELCSFYNEFNECAETEAGKPMLDGIKSFEQALKQVDDQSVIVFYIG